MLQRTFVAIKPDAVERGLIGEIIKRFEKKQYKIVAMKMLHVDQDLASKHYEEHIGKPFFQELVDFITSGPIVAMAVEGQDVIQGVRHIVGATNPLEAAPGTIRCDFAQVKQNNVVHASDCEVSAKRELDLYFAEKEYC
jgi:nucleoside-diphosphate kinase